MCNIFFYRKKVPGGATDVYAVKLSSMYRGRREYVGNLVTETTAFAASRFIKIRHALNDNRPAT